MKDADLLWFSIRAPFYCGVALLLLEAAANLFLDKDLDVMEVVWLLSIFLIYQIFKYIRGSNGQ